MKNLVLFNGVIHTLDTQKPTASAIGMRGNEIVFVGGDKEALALFNNEPCERVDLKGATVIPGLTDAHLHFEYYSMMLQTINAELPAAKDVVAKVAEKARSLPEGKWITGFGWNHNEWGGEFPNAAMLDEVSPRHPVSLQAKSGHAIWVNSAALREVGITDDTPDPEGGHIVRDAAGKATGIILEEAMWMVDRKIPAPTVEELAAAIENGLQTANRHGLTGVHDLDQPSVFKAFQRLHKEGKLTLRVNKGIPLAYLDAAVAAGLYTGFGDDMLHLGPVKMFADGALGPRTAWMLAGYDSAPEDLGISTTDVEVLCESTLKANSNGLAVAIHAIGDRANREVLNIFAEAKKQYPHSGLRNRIEHVQLLAPEDLGRLAELGVIASMQPLHATSDMYIADKHWGNRVTGAYALKTQLQKGAVLALGSDCPVETLDPLTGIHAAVTRRRSDGTPCPEGWRPEQRLTVEEAVRGYTQGPAYACGMEDRLGTIKEGYLADLTILEKDIFAIDPMDILKTEVVGTVVNGKFVWRSEAI
ncbi:MAG: amidohydrolase [Leptolinea sp.]|nr:amidohydrolase [Leptolinea sp.]